MHRHLHSVVFSFLVLGTELSHAQATAVEEPPQQQIASSNADQAWRPSIEQRKAIEAITQNYFALRDGGKMEQAYALVSPRQKQYLSYSTFSRLAEEFNSKAGAAQGRTLRKITWYRDTPQAGPGLYVAVDFSSKFENLALHCGYVVWQEQPDGSFLQVREEVNVIDNATMARLGPERLAQVRTQFGC
jgi:Protein of unknown function (DUF4019)